MNPLLVSSCAQAALLVLVTGPPASQSHFIDRGAEAGADLLSFGRGAGMADLNGDGRPDLVATDAGTGNTFLRQRPNHSFKDVTADWGIAPVVQHSWGVLIADYDNDGDSDVLFPNGGFTGPEPNQLLRNDLSTSDAFVDVSEAAGDVAVPGKNFGGTLLDYDRDGDLDVFLTTAGGTCTLLENDGELVFTDVSAAAGIVHTGPFRHCGAGDYDNDGWMDVGAGELVRNRLYHNEGDGTFTEVAGALGVASPNPPGNFGFVFADFSGDGWLDVYVPKYQEEPTGPSQLFLNQGDGTFANVTLGSGMSGQTDMGHDVGDLDADGFPDIYIGTGAPQATHDDVLFSVTPGGASGLLATDVSVAWGILEAGPTRLHGMAMGDYDLDGDVDVYSCTGGPSILPATNERNQLWQNQGNANGWIALDLVAVRSPRTPVGARILARTPSGKEAHDQVSVGRGFANTPSATQHLGLGSESAVERVQIDWPSGIRQTLLSPPANQRLSVVETGIRLVGTPSPGGTVLLETCGLPANQSLLLYSLSTLSLPLPTHGGILGVGLPFVQVGLFSLDAQGKHALTLPVPDDPELVGATVWLQSWIHPPGAVDGGVLSNTVPMTL